MKVHISAIISKPNEEWQSYGPDTKKIPIFEIWPRSVTLILELQTWILRAKHCLMKVNISAVILKSIKEWQSYSLETKKKILFWPLTSKCDLDLRATDLALTHDTLSHKGQNFCQVFSKSIEEWQSYGPDMKKKLPLFLPLTYKCDLDLDATDLGLAS